MSTTSRLKRRHAARLRRIKRLRKAGRLPVHTRTERKRQEREWQKEREARRQRAGRARQGTGVAVGAIFAGVMLGAWTTQAAASTPPAAAHGYRAYQSLRAEMARREASGVPRVMPLSSLYAFERGRPDDLPHPEPTAPTLYPGGPPYGGTAPSVVDLTGPRPAGARPAWDSPRYGPWERYRTQGGAVSPM